MNWVNALLVAEVMDADGTAGASVVMYVTANVAIHI